MSIEHQLFDEDWDALAAELDRVRDIVRGLLTQGIHTYRTESGRQACAYCLRSVPGPAPFELNNPDKHDPACPWRQAAAYVAGLTEAA